MDSRDYCTEAPEMIAQGEEMNTWDAEAHIKLPITTQGLKAAEALTKKGLNVNMTLNFSQKQAAAVHAATRGAKKGEVFISPFDGRLDDSGVQGDDLTRNMLQMYKENNSHVQVLTASVRDLDSFLYSIYQKTDLITAPLKVLEQWAENDLMMPVNMEDLDHNKGLAPIVYEDLDLSLSWDKFDIQHDLTDAGIKKFSKDWNSIIEK